jgi:tRNA-Thr(GGU) m(6)t(6)A37 methyltransferase TsaA
VNPIAIFHSPFPTKFGIPRQAGVVSEIPGTIIFEKPFRTPDAIRGLEGFDFIWIIWQSSATNSSPTVRPPRLGGNTRVGVFASRSPQRPNPIGLSSVRISHIDYDAPDGPVIHVLGADIMDGTPILDIKPYIPYTDSHPEARGGFTDTTDWHPLKVVGTDDSVLKQILEQDPRPHYHDDPDRIYGMQYNGKDIHFKVKDKTLFIIDE